MTTVNEEAFNGSEAEGGRTPLKRNLSDLQSHLAQRFSQRLSRSCPPLARQRGCTLRTGWPSDSGENFRNPLASDIQSLLFTYV